METKSLGEDRLLKKLYFIDGLPYCSYLPIKKLIRMNTLNMSLIPYEYMEKVFMQINSD